MHILPEDGMAANLRPSRICLVSASFVSSRARCFEPEAGSLLPLSLRRAQLVAFVAVPSFASFGSLSLVGSLFIFGSLSFLTRSLALTITAYAADRSQHDGWNEGERGGGGGAGPL